MKKIIALAVLLLLVMAYCQSQKTGKDTENLLDEYSDIINDSFIVRYNQPVNGYNVEAIVKLGGSGDIPRSVLGLFVSFPVYVI